MRRLLPGIRIALIGAALLLQSFAATAADLYQIEMVVFARTGGSAEEPGVSGQGLAYPLRTSALQPALEDATSIGSFQQLPASARLLNNEAATLGRRGFPILFHAAWRQPVDTPQLATGVIVEGGRSAGPYRELSGYVALSAENYLHIDMNLWLSQFANAGEQPLDAPKLPLPPGVFADPAAEAPPLAKLLVLSQRRKLRSGELHYFDHPQFGAIVTVTPVHD